MLLVSDCGPMASSPVAAVARVAVGAISVLPIAILAGLTEAGGDALPINHEAAAGPFVLLLPIHK